MAMMRPTVRPWYGRRRRRFTLPDPQEDPIENTVVVNGETVVFNGETVVHTE